jgi:predicted ATPase/DNA-binding SARP family transcriptional activator
MAPTLILRLLGTPTIERNGQPITALLGSKAQAILYYLALTQQPQTRTALTVLLWGDFPEEAARTNLRQTIADLRKVLAPFLQIDRHTLALRPESCVVDAVAFVQRMVRALVQPDLVEMEAALALYRGEFLAGFAVRGAPDFDRWQYAEQERLRQLAIRGLEALASAKANAGQVEAAIAHLRQVLALEPWREEAHRQTMEWLARSDQRSAALAQYETLVRLLAEHLGVAPADETIRLRERLVQQQIAADLHSQATPTVAAEAGFVGRRAEWQRLQETWREVMRGRTHFVAICGEAGIGKTRLAEELLAWAGHQGIGAARTHAYAVHSSLAYTAVTELFRTDELRTRLARLSPVWLGEVARLLPELLEAHPDLPQPEPVRESWQQQRFFRALAAALRTDERPLLLLFDDLHWCDQQTLQWLHYLLLSEHQARLLVIGTVRIEEVEADHPLSALLHDLQRHDQLTQIPLAPLNAEEAAALAAHVSQRALTPEQARQLYQETEGNPLFVVETMRAGFNSGADQSDGRSGSPVPALESATSTLAPKITSVIRARLAQLSPPARELASLAATIGRPFTFEVVHLASQHDEDTLVRQLDVLGRRRILLEQGVDAYDFSHKWIRDVAYAEASRTQRRQWHRRIAEALVRTPGAESGELAFHYEQAGLWEAAVTHYHHAAEAAQRIFARAEAAEAALHAVNLLSHLPDTPARMEREIILQALLGQTLTSIKGYAAPEVDIAFSRAHALSSQIAKTPQLTPALISLGIYSLVRGDIRTASSLCGELMELAQQAQQPDLLLVAHFSVGATSYYLGHLAEAVSHLETALALYTPAAQERLVAAHDWDLMITSLYHLALALWFLGHVDQAQARSREAQARAEAMQNPYALTTTLHLGGIIQQLCGNVEAARRLSEQGLDLAVKYDFPYQQALHLSLLGWVRTQEGEIEAGIALMRQGLAILEAIGVGLERSYYLALLGEAYQNLGEIDAALQILEEALVQMRRGSDYLWESELIRLRAELLHRQGEPDDQVEADLEQAVAIARRQNTKSLELRASVSLSRLWQQQGNSSQARQLLSAIYGWFREGFDTLDLQDAKALLDELA